MKYKIFIILITFIFTQFAIAQSDSIRYKNAIIFSPISCLIEYNYPAIQLGYSREIKKQWALQFEVGYILNSPIIKPFPGDISAGISTVLNNEYRYTWNTTNKGYKLRTELKHFVKYWDKKTSRMYFASEIYFTRSKYHLKTNYLGFYKDGDDSNFSQRNTLDLDTKKLD